MSKQGMKRIDKPDKKEKREMDVVPEIQGKAKHGKIKVNPIIAGTEPPSQKVFHTKPYSRRSSISSAYSVYNMELARDNLDNDLSAADLQDL